jgi:hypothetical protein
MHNLTPATKTILLSGPVAAGQALVTTPTVDTSGYKGVRFIAILGAVAAGAICALKVQGGALSGGGDAADLEGSNTPALDTDDGKLLILDIHKPRHRYARAAVERTVADSAITAIIAELYNPNVSPVVHDASVANQTVLSEPYAGDA